MSGTTRTPAVSEPEEVPQAGLAGPEDRKPLGDPAPGDGDGDGRGGGGTVTLPRLGAVGWLRWAWRQLTSMRTALLLLLLLAVAAVPGSVFPQRRIDPGAVLAYKEDNPGVAPLLDRLGLFDVYSSPWFSAVYLLLFVSLVGCVLPRSRVHLRALRAAPPRTPRRLDRMQGHLTATTDAPPQEVLAAARAVLRRRRYRLADHDDAASTSGTRGAAGGAGSGGSISAERGYLAETGNLVFHLALLGLLVAVAAGSVLGYSGQALVMERGSFSNTLPRYDSFEAGSGVDRDALAPFAFTLEELTVRFEEQAGSSQQGAPREFTARLSVQDEPGAPERTVLVRPNQPLDVEGARAFLVGNGYAPEITVRDGEGRVAFSGPVPFLDQGDGQYTSLGVVKVPDAAPRQLALRGFLLPTAVLDPETGLPISVFPDARLPRLVLTAYASRPGEDGLRANTGAPESVFVLDDRNLEQLRGDRGEPVRLVLAPGSTLGLPGGVGTVTFDGLRRYGVFDVRHDPAKGWALLFGSLALAGVTASLFVRRRRVWVRARTTEDGRTLVEAAGLARGEDTGLADEVALVLQGAVGQPAPADGPSTNTRAGSPGPSTTTSRASTPAPSKE